MSMDAARARLPECPVCGYGVDENAELAYYFIDGMHYHWKCYEGKSGLTPLTPDRLRTSEESASPFSKYIND